MLFEHAHDGDLAMTPKFRPVCIRAKIQCPTNDYRCRINNLFHREMKDLEKYEKNDEKENDRENGEADNNVNDYHYVYIFSPPFSVPQILLGCVLLYIYVYPIQTNNANEMTVLWFL